MIKINGKRATPNEAAKSALLEILMQLYGDAITSNGAPIPVLDVVDVPAAMTEHERAKANEQYRKKLEALINRLGAGRVPRPGIDDFRLTEKIADLIRP
jgi:hypothetical protein